MPVYTYRCRACDYEFDRRQRMSEDPLVECPNCGELELRKVVNSVGVVFKGSGFYVTDNRNGSAKGASSKSESTSKSSTDNKTNGDTKSTESSGAAETKSNTATEKTSTPAA